MIKIIILGGGFGGVRAALELEKRLRNNKEVQINLIDKKAYHAFIPAFYEIASAYGIKHDPFSVKLKKTVCIPYSDIFENKNINFIQAEIVNINVTRQMVQTKGGMVLDYDYLILAFGSETEDYGVPGVVEYAYKFKTLEDSLLINNELEKVSNEFLDQKRNRPFSFLICGAGFTGVELAAELGSCANVIKSRCKLKAKPLNIIIFESANNILPMISDKERKIITNRLTKLGVVVMQNSKIEGVGSNFVQLNSGKRIEGDLVVWNAGVRGAAIIKNTEGLNLSSKGTVLVEANLLATGYKNIFAIGDNNEFIDPKTQRSVPNFGYVAAEQGSVAAINTVNLIDGKKLKDYHPNYNVWIAPIGGKFAVAHLWGLIMFKGFLAWTLRELVDLKYLLSIFSVRKALEIFWAEIALFTKNDSSN